MNKVVYNGCYGGFSLSEEAAKMFNERKGLKKGDEMWINPRYGYYEVPRHDKDLVAVVEELGLKKASGRYADLRITEVGNKYRIDEYDGWESVVEPEYEEYVCIED